MNVARLVAFETTLPQQTSRVSINVKLQGAHVQTHWHTYLEFAQRMNHENERVREVEQELCVGDVGLCEPTE